MSPNLASARRLAATLLAAAVAFTAPARAMPLDQLAHAARTLAPGLFGYAEFSAPSTLALPQWRRVRDDMAHTGPTLSRCVRDERACATDAQRAWRRAISSAAALTKGERPHAVNRFFNRWPYRLDHEIHNMREYWATPAEFLRRSGDCEDYAIAKYYALRQLGFAADELRIVVLTDAIRGVGHAVLAVYIDDDVRILDSVSDMIVSHTVYRHYRPLYSVNEDTRWLHASARARPLVIN